MAQRRTYPRGTTSIAHQTIRAEMHALFAGEGDLRSAIEQVARLSVRRTFQVVPRGFSREETDAPVMLPWVPAASVFCTDPDGHSLGFLSVLADAPRPELGVVSGLSWADWQRVVREG